MVYLMPCFCLENAIQCGGHDLHTTCTAVLMTFNPAFALFPASVDETCTYVATQPRRRVQPASAHRQALPRTVTRFVLEAEEHGHGRGRFQVSGSGKRAASRVSYAVEALRCITCRLLSADCSFCCYTPVSAKSFFCFCFVILDNSCCAAASRGAPFIAFAGLPILIFCAYFVCTVYQEQEALFVRTLAVL